MADTSKELSVILTLRSSYEQSKIKPYNYIKDL
jgi:hypothetical protein